MLLLLLPMLACQGVVVWLKRLPRLVLLRLQGCWYVPPCTAAAAGQCCWHRHRQHLRHTDACTAAALLLRGQVGPLVLDPHLQASRQRAWGSSCP